MPTGAPGLAVRSSDAAEVAGSSGSREDADASASGETDVTAAASSSSSTSSSSSSSASSSSSSSSPSVSEHSGSPQRPRKLAKLVARAVAKRVGSRKGRKGGNTDPPLYADMVRCANTAVTRGLRKSVKKRIRKGKYVDIFTLTEEAKKEFDKAKKSGEAAVEACRDFNHWLRGFSVFATCYLETRPQEHINVLKYQFLVNELFMVDKSPRWREYDEKFRRNQCGNATLPLGFKNVEVWKEVVGRAGGGGQKVADAQPKRPFPAAKAGGSAFTKGKCFAFNDGKCDKGTRCRFRHSCRVCGGSHPAKDCKAQGGVAASLRGEVGGGSK